MVKEVVDARNLKTPVRTLVSGRVKGGAAFSYGHIHYILTNPVYAGRIRHHAKVYPGQHEPLIQPAVWDSIQEQLQSDAAKDRTFTKRNRNGVKASTSLLAGKLFDQTGDRLTPSHSKSAKGRKLRYYVSHRLVRGSSPRDPSGWRLPAHELEGRVADLVRQYLNRPEVRVGLIPDASVDEAAAAGDRLLQLTGAGSEKTTEASRLCLNMVTRIGIAPGDIRVSLSGNAIAERLDVDPARIVHELLSFIAPFQHRKRGVETKLIIGEQATDVDRTLLRNIGNAHRYFDLVRSGRTFGEIAESEGVSKRRVQQVIELAFLAPDII